MEPVLLPFRLSGRFLWATVLGLLRRPQGATIADVMKAAGWQPHSVRGLFAGVVRKKLGLLLLSQKSDDNRICRIVQGGKAGPAQHQQGG